MKFFRLDLLTLLISLFILNSCKNQDTIGLGVNSTSQIDGNIVDTSTVYVKTVREDSVVTSGGTKLPIGYFKDPILGVSEANIAASLSLPNTSGYSLPSGTISIDSTRLVLNYADGFYGDSIATSYKLNVYQLGEMYDENKSYYSTKQWQNSGTLLGSATFKARTHDSIKVYNIISGAPDTLIKVAPQLRIPVSNNFVITNLLNASSSTLASNSLFQNKVKGLYLTLDQAQITGAGGTFMFKNTDTLMIYCKINKNGTVDTTQIKLPITKMAASIAHTYPDAITSALNSTSNTSNTFYLQGLLGLRTKISFPNLLVNLRKQLAEQGKDIILNRADLVIIPSAGTDIPYKPLPKITMYKLDIAHQRIPVQDASTTDPRQQTVGSFGGFYNPTKKEYHFIITAFLQDLLLKRTQDYGTYLAPVDTTNTSAVDIVSTPAVAARTVAVGTDGSSPYKIQLRIIYTKISK